MSEMTFSDFDQYEKTTLGPKRANICFLVNPTDSGIAS